LKKEAPSLRVGAFYFQKKAWSFAKQKPLIKSWSFTEGKTPLLSGIAG